MNKANPSSTSQPAVMFLHANGYPSGTYGRFLGHLSEFADVCAPAVIDTPVGTRASRRWPDMLRDVLATIRELALPERSLTLVGHSMGGFLSLMAAAQELNCVKKIVLIDVPIVVGWRSALLSTVQTVGLHYRVGPAPIAARRKYRWPSVTQAHEHFLSKDFVRRWDQGVLEDFLAHGLAHGSNGQVELRVARERERDIYAYLPARNAHRAYRKLLSASIPIHLIAGTHSAEMKMAGRGNNRRLFGKRWHEIDSGHLIPMERPLDCAKMIKHCIELPY